MTRDEIIKGLEKEIRRIHREPKRKMLGIFMTVDEAEDIVALLKGQEPVEPIYVMNPYTGLPVSYCPRCRESIRKFRYGEAYKESKYCTFCGQAMKWDE